MYSSFSSPRALCSLCAVPFYLFSAILYRDCVSRHLIPQYLALPFVVCPRIVTDESRTPSLMTYHDGLILFPSRMRGVERLATGCKIAVYLFSWHALCTRVCVCFIASAASFWFRLKVSETFRKCFSEHNKIFGGTLVLIIDNAMSPWILFFILIQIFFNQTNHCSGISLKNEAYHSSDNKSALRSF